MRKIGPLYERVASVRLTVGLCILLAVVSVLGTIVPQNLSFEEYQSLYGPGLARVLSTLGFFDLYHSPGFVLLLCLLSLNLVACTSRRLPHVWRALRREPAVPGDLRFQNWRCRETFQISATAGEIEGKLARALAGALGGRPRRKENASGTLLYLIEKNRYARLGPYLAHGGIIVILLGAMWGALGGFKGNVQLAEGEETSSVLLQKEGGTVDLDFRVRCDRFVVDHYPDGTPREYRTDLTLLGPGGEELLKGTVRVNHPLSYKGIAFYQSTYGTIPEVVLSVRRRDGGEATRVRTRLGIPFLLPGGEGENRAMVIAFKEDLRIPEEMVRMTSFPRQNLGPAVRIVVFDDQGFSEPFWVFRDLPDYDPDRRGPYRFLLEDYHTVPYAGLQVAKDPGVPLVWFGCALLVVGFMMAFLLDHEILWVSAEPGENDSYTVRMAGRATRHPSVYVNRFDARKQRLRKSLSTRMKPSPASRSDVS